MESALCLGYELIHSAVSGMWDVLLLVPAAAQNEHVAVGQTRDVEHTFDSLSEWRKICYRLQVHKTEHLSNRFPMLSPQLSES